MGRREITCKLVLSTEAIPLKTNKQTNTLGCLLLPCHHTPIKAEFSFVLLPQNLLEALEGSSREDPISILGIKWDKCLLLPSFLPLPSSTDPSGSSVQGWISSDKSEAFHMKTLSKCNGWLEPESFCIFANQHLPFRGKKYKRISANN